MFSRCTVWMKERCGADGISAMALWKFWFLFGMIVSPFKLRNLVSSSPALLKMLLALCSTNNFSDFLFFPWLWRHTKQPKYHVVYCAQVFSWTKAVIHRCYFKPVRDGKVILVCTLARDSPVSLGVMSTWWGQPATWHKDVLPFWEAVIYQP